jgi:hypothetical protein
LGLIFWVAGTGVHSKTTYFGPIRIHLIYRCAQDHPTPNSTLLKLGAPPPSRVFSVIFTVALPLTTHNLELACSIGSAYLVPSSTIEFDVSAASINSIVHSIHATMAKAAATTAKPKKAASSSSHASYKGQLASRIIIITT